MLRTIPAHEKYLSVNEAIVHGEATTDHKSVILIATGNDWAIARAAKRLALLTPLFKPTNPPGALTVPLTWPAMVQLASTFGDRWRPGPRLSRWVTDEIQRRTDIKLATVGELPKDKRPRDYQLLGARIIAQCGAALITDEPGTGKTITAILGLLALHRGFPALVVCPASVVDPWVEAWQDWAPWLRVVAWRGPKRHEAMGLADVYVTSYDTARMDSSDIRTGLLKMAFQAMVIDECHLIKNQKAARSLAVRRLAKKARHVVALSGTPITHNPADLWPTLQALAPNAWPSRERWVERYCETVSTDYQTSILGLHPHREEEFRLTLLGQHRRIAKKDVLTELPPKVYSVRSVEMPAEYRKSYDAMEHQMLAELPDGGELSAMSVLTQLTRLSQLASSAADVRILTEIGPDGTEVEHQHVTLKAPSWKVDTLLEVLAERPGQPVVAFAPSRQLMVLAETAAKAAGLRVGLLVGGQAARVRTGVVVAFQSGELDLLCATTGAGGTGITLTAASTCVFLQRPWSLVEALQAEDRCHRIGSEIHDSIEIIDVIATNTIDTRIRTVLKQKAGQLSDLVQDPRIVAELLGGASVTRMRKKAS